MVNWRQLAIGTATVIAILTILSFLCVDGKIRGEQSARAGLSLSSAFALLLQVTGNWNNIAKLEDQLPGLEQRLGLTVTAHCTRERTGGRDLLPYGVDVVAMDQPGIVHNLAKFFSERQINIQEMLTSSYAAAHSGTPMFSVHMTVEVPASIQIAGLREEFMDFCDQLNLDAVIEPIKA